MKMDQEKTAVAPMEMPETAVLGELHYGKKQITLYPKKGQWEGGDEPFDLKETTAEEIAKYASLSSDDTLNSIAEDSDKRIESKFEKMIQIFAYIIFL